MTTAGKSNLSKKEVTRRKIVAAARRVFTRHPYHKASLRAIAAEGRFHFSLINHYFSKAELFGAVAAEVSQELLQAYQDWMTDLASADPENGLGLFLDRALAYLFEKPDVLMLLMKNAGEAGTEESAPAFEYFSGYVFNAGTTLTGSLPSRVNEEHVIIWFYGLLNMLINYVGAADYHGQILNLSPDSRQYRQWVKKSLMYLFLPGLKEMISQAGADVQPGESQG